MSVVSVVWGVETMDYLTPCSCQCLSDCVCGVGCVVWRLWTTSRLALVNVCLIVSVVWGVETVDYLMPCSCQCLSDCVCGVGCGDYGLPHALLLSMLV